MVSIKLNTARLRAELSHFVRDLAPKAVDIAVRRTAFAVGGDIVRAINGAGAGFAAPRRIDTGRYRAGWSMAVQAASGRAPGPTTASVPVLSSDGAAERVTTATGTTIRVINNVEYGQYVEHGTQHMRPGHHVALSLLKHAATLRLELGKTIPQAWRGELAGTVL